MKFPVNIKKWVQYLCVPLLIGVAGQLFFGSFAQAGGKHLLLIYLPALLLLLALQASIKNHLCHYSIVAPLSLLIIWSTGFVAFSYYGNGEVFPFTRVMANYLFGLGIFAALVFLQSLWASKSKKNKLQAAIFTVVDFGLLIIPLAQLGYFWLYHKSLTMDSLFALYQTNLDEAREFIQAALSFTDGIVLVIILAVVLSIYYFFNLALAKHYHQMARASFKYAALLLFVAVSLGFFFKTNIVYTLYKINDYSAQLKSYGVYQQQVMQNLQLDKTNSTIAKTPGTIILVVGESAARDQMQVFNPHLKVDNTPWQLEMAKNRANFHFFNHAYTSWAQTVPSLQRALSEQNQYNDKDFLHSANILNIANKLEYHTYWFSNQGMVGQYDTTTTLIAKTAGTVDFTKKDLSDKVHYDGELLKFLKEVPKDQNNFIVIHLMGSHLGYDSRYPQEAKKFKDIKHASYYNTINYTDDVLREIYTYAKADLNLQAMVYFSDHGEDMALNHNPDAFTFAMARIPLWIYTSDQYNKAYPLTARTMADHQNKFFTNDLLYDLMVGLFQAKGNRYNPENDLLNPQYKFNEHNLTTNLGKTKLTEDPNLYGSIPLD